MFRKMLLWKGLSYYATNNNGIFQQTWQRYIDNDLENYPLVTRVFLKHLREPKKWPLFDINVWKAMRRRDEKIANQTNANYRDADYERFYKPFFNWLYAQPHNDFGQPPQIQGVDEEIIKRRILDRALWEYGRILLPNG